MTGPELSQEALDNLNMTLFEISESDNNDPYSFYAAVANVCRSAGLPIKDASLMLLDEPDYETWPQVCKVDGEAIYLYLAYSRARENYPFSSHAELVDTKDLDAIMRLSNLSAMDDSNEDSDND